MKKEYKLLPNGNYKYEPRKKVMFGKEIEAMFEAHSQEIKTNKKQKS